MTLGEIIKDYREKHDMSMRDFETLSGISRGYLSMLEKNQNPRSKKPITPSIDMIKQVASAIGMTFDQIFDLMDGQEVSLVGNKLENSLSLSDEEMEVIMAYRRTDDIGRLMVQRSLGIDELLDYKRESTPPH